MTPCEENWTPPYTSKHTFFHGVCIRYGESLGEYWQEIDNRFTYELNKKLALDKR